MMEQKNFLISGGAGFIGSHLVEKLVARGHNVTVLDDMSAGKMSNLDFVKDIVDVFVEGVENPKIVDKLAEDTDVIFHLATQCLVKGNEEPMLIHRVNDIGTYNVCVAAKKHGCKIVFIGTSEMYGRQTVMPICESAVPNPMSLYGMTKIVGEEYVRFFNAIYGVPAVCIRPFNTFGPRQREDVYAGVITSFIKRLIAEKPLIIHGDGKQRRDFTYVSDMVEGILRLSTLEKGEVVNLGSTKTTSILELADLIVGAWKGKTKFDYDVKHVDARVNDLRELKADTTYAQSLGYSPKTSLKEGIKNYVKWYKSRFNRI